MVNFPQCLQALWDALYSIRSLDEDYDNNTAYITGCHVLRDAGWELGDLSDEESIVLDMD